MADAVVGVLTKLSFAAAGTAIGSYSVPMEFVSESMKKQGSILDTAGLRGTRSHASERTVAGPYTVGGQIVFDATPTLLDTILPYILGAAESTDVFALAETLSYFDILVDKGPQRHVYGNCKVDKATFSCGPNQTLRVALDIVGETETVSATAFPTLTAPTDPPYTFHQLVSTLVSGTRITLGVEVVIDNGLTARFSNSQSATSIMPTDRNVTVKVTTPYTSAEYSALYGQALLGTTGTLVFTNGGLSTTFTFATLQVPDMTPTVNGRGEMVLEQNGVARMSSTTRELVITSDSAP